MLVIQRQLAQAILNYLVTRPHLYAEIRELVIGLEQSDPIEKYIKQYEKIKQNNKPTEMHLVDTGDE